MPERDFLDRMVAKRTKRKRGLPQTPRFSDPTAGAVARLGSEHREAENLTQTQIAAAMETSQSFVAPAGEHSRRREDLHRRPVRRVAWLRHPMFHLVPAANSGDSPAVVVH